MKRYRRKPGIVEAIQWKGNNFNEIQEFCPLVMLHPIRVYSIQIPTTEGIMIADLDDWITMAIKGEFKVCKHGDFDATYAEVSA